MVEVDLVDAPAHPQTLDVGEQLRPPAKADATAVHRTPSHLELAARGAALGRRLNLGDELVEVAHRVGQRPDLEVAVQDGRADGVQLLRDEADVEERVGLVEVRVQLDADGRRGEAEEDLGEELVREAVEGARLLERVGATHGALSSWLGGAASVWWEEEEREERETDPSELAKARALRPSHLSCELRLRTGCRELLDALAEQKTKGAG